MNEGNLPDTTVRPNKGLHEAIAAASRRLEILHRFAQMLQRDIPGFAGIRSDGLIERNAHITFINDEHDDCKRALALEFGSAGWKVESHSYDNESYSYEFTSGDVTILLLRAEKVGPRNAAME